MMLWIIMAVWIGGGLLEAAVGGVMWRRKVYREYPFFFAYILNQLLRFAVLFPIFLQGNRPLYAQAFAVFEAIDAAMSFAVIYELFRVTFDKYEGIRELGWILMKWAAVVLLAISTITAATSTHAAEDTVFLSGLYTLESSVSMLRAGLLFLLFILYSALGLRWTKVMLGVATGFAVVTSVGLATFTLRTYYGPPVYVWLSLISTGAYDCALLVWLYAVAAPSRARTTVMRPPKWDVEGWDRAILELLHR